MKPLGSLVVTVPVSRTHNGGLAGSDDAVLGFTRVIFQVLIQGLDKSESIASDVMFFPKCSVTVFGVYSLRSPIFDSGVLPSVPTC